MTELEAQHLLVPYDAWYHHIDSRCSACGHGPLKHTLASDGCNNMTDGWCPCLLVWTDLTGYNPAGLP